MPTTYYPLRDIPLTLISHEPGSVAEWRGGNNNISRISCLEAITELRETELINDKLGEDIGAACEDSQQLKVYD
ncbi:hypothetical protein K0M31_006213 [Melipona bicolor]|uniref:Uncharacterized protein n=1 Tax=Melipona bicolor TaxID=60889 RepID=A0AA40FT33_9HYME|nr:hypothetical protein K0M31_006213 [Melipona bicolor]